MAVSLVTTGNVEAYITFSVVSLVNLSAVMTLDVLTDLDNRVSAFAGIGSIDALLAIHDLL